MSIFPKNCIHYYTIRYSLATLFSFNKDNIFCSLPTSLFTKTLFILGTSKVFYTATLILWLMLSDWLYFNSSSCLILHHAQIVLFQTFVELRARLRVVRDMACVWFGAKTVRRRDTSLTLCHSNNSSLGGTVLYIQKFWKF